MDENVGSATRAVSLVSESVEKWRERLPDTREAFFQWCVEAGTDDLLELLAIGTAHTVNTTLFRGVQSQQARSCDRLANALDIDPLRWTDLESLQVLSAAPKALSVQAITEVHGETRAAKLSGKKADVVAQAVELCNGSWLPWPLHASGPSSRRVKSAAANDEVSEQSQEGTIVPEITDVAVDEDARAPW